MPDSAPPTRSVGSWFAPEAIPVDPGETVLATAWRNPGMNRWVVRVTVGIALAAFVAASLIAAQPAGHPAPLPLPTGPWVPLALILVLMAMPVVGGLAFLWRYRAQRAASPHAHTYAVTTRRLLVPTDTGRRAIPLETITSVTYAPMGRRITVRLRGGEIVTLHLQYVFNDRRFVTTLIAAAQAADVRVAVA